MPDSEYVFLNAETGIYFYHEDESVLNTETADSGYWEILQQIQTNGSIVDDVGRILGEIADGNLTVNVTENEAYCIGDFKILSESLKPIHANLVRVIRDISLVAKQVDTSADQVSTGAQALSRGTVEQAASVDRLVSNVTAITSQIQDSTLRCGSATEPVNKATGYAAEADTRMEQLVATTKNIDRSSAQIVTITKSMEDIAFQTKLLALNAPRKRRARVLPERAFLLWQGDLRRL